MSTNKKLGPRQLAAHLAQLERNSGSSKVRGNFLGNIAFNTDGTLSRFKNCADADPRDQKQIRENSRD